MWYIINQSWINAACETRLAIQAIQYNALDTQADAGALIFNLLSPFSGGPLSPQSGQQPPMAVPVAFALLQLLGQRLLP